MPQNTTVPNPGTELGYQNPGTVNAALDAEVVGTDPVTGAQLTREFVIPIESISGQSEATTVTTVLGLILNELRAIRLLMEAEAVPEIVDEVGEVIAVSEEAETEESQGN